MGSARSGWPDVAEAVQIVVTLFAASAAFGWLVETSKARGL